ncbi:tetratricopeptide repeat protein [Maricaulis maris]|uniref:tetratricopeptide repeat protein n=1 Tax=Maricaulis maris TaxID=74318 RepID=UPI003B8ABDB0
MLRVCLMAGLVAFSGTDSLAWGQAQTPPPSLRELAETGDPEAAFDYGYDLTFPESGEPDTVTGRYWLIQAANAGYAPANAILGVIYRDGFGVAPDIDRARAFLELAWTAQDAFAGHELAELLLYDFPGERVAAIEILESLLGNVDIGPVASLTLAESLMFDGSTEAEFARAVTLARDALDRDPELARAHYILGIGAAEGYAGPVDQAEARRVWHAGAEASDSLALIALAETWLDDDWGSPDPVQAYVLYTLAADLGDSDAADAAETIGGTLDPDGRADAAGRRAAWESRMGRTALPD